MKSRHDFRESLLDKIINYLLPNARGNSYSPPCSEGKLLQHMHSSTISEQSCTCIFHLLAELTSSSSIHSNPLGAHHDDATQ
jgi:hypothetical protein